jgi:signal recognition particle GTPase
VRTALREVRVALLEADVSLPVVRDFVKRVEAEATGARVTKSVTPGQQVVKIVHDELVKMLEGEGDPGTLKIDNPPAPILMVGLQGGGKTTTSSAAAAFDRADADRNGMLSPQEASTFPAIGERFQSLDKNQDKMLSREEFEAGAKS